MSDSFFGPGMNSCFDLVSARSTDVSIASYVFVPYYSLTQIKSEQVPLEFSVSCEHYIMQRVNFKIACLGSRS